MSRKRRAEKRIIPPDSRHHNVLISKLINKVMLDGKKSIAEKIVYAALETLSAKVKVGEVESFEAGKYEEPADLVVYTTEPIVKAIMNLNESQFDAIQEAMDNGEIVIDPNGFVNNIVFFFGKLFLTIAGWFT